MDSFSTVGIYSQRFLKHRNNFQLVNWKFYKGDVHKAEDPDREPGKGWEDITAPHTYNSKDVLTEGMNYYQGIGWYRSTFALSRDKENKRYFIRFEGVSLVADVFINGYYQGRHKGGYSAFCYEITSYIQRGQNNTVAVKVDNSTQVNVAPSGTDLYPFFGGIYRPVTIFSTDDLCVSPLDYASSGVYIRPVNVSAKKADIEVVTLLDYVSNPVLYTKSCELLPPKDQKGIGLQGEYFANPHFKGKPKHIRIDEEINFDYGTQGPSLAGMPKNNFSIIWKGRFVPERTSTYKFVLKSDDGSRLF